MPYVIIRTDEMSTEIEETNFFVFVSCFALSFMIALWRRTFERLSERMFLRIGQPGANYFFNDTPVRQKILVVGCSSAQ